MRYFQLLPAKNLGQLNVGIVIPPGVPAPFIPPVPPPLPTTGMFTWPIAISVPVSPTSFTASIYFADDHTLANALLPTTATITHIKLFNVDQSGTDVSGCLFAQWVQDGDSTDVAPSHSAALWGDGTFEPDTPPAPSGSLIVDRDDGTVLTVTAGVASLSDTDFPELASIIAAAGLITGIATIQTDLGIATFCFGTHTCY